MRRKDTPTKVVATKKMFAKNQTPEVFSTKSKKTKKGKKNSDE